MKIAHLLFSTMTLLALAACENPPHPIQRTASGQSPYNDLVNAFGGASVSETVSAYVAQTRTKQKEHYKIVILTDEPGATRANAIAAGFRGQQPWSIFNIEIEVVNKTSEELECAEGEEIKRLLTANTSLASREASRRGANQAMIVCNLPFGGSGGDVPIIAADGEAVETAFHEFMHTLGFSDEYRFSASEAAIYCSDIDDLTRVNLARITPEPSYASDSDARTRHHSAIPWYGHILGSTLITNGNQLGTDSSLRNVFGLFEAETCKSATPIIAMWKPGGETSIMQTTRPGTLISGTHSTLLFDILVDTGVPLRELPNESSDTRVHDGRATPDTGTNAAPAGHGATAL